MEGLLTKDKDFISITTEDYNNHSAYIAHVGYIWYATVLIAIFYALGSFSIGKKNSPRPENEFLLHTVGALDELKKCNKKVM